MSAADMVILTRAPEDNARLAAELSERGLRVVEVPCVGTRVREVDLGEVGGTGLAEFAAVAFTSRRAVEAVAPVWTTFAGLLAAVGEATAEAMTVAFGRRPDVVSAEGTGESLARQLASQLSAGAAVLHLRGDKTTGTLGQGLVAAGLEFHEEVVYDNVGPVVERLTGVVEGTLAVFASPSAAHRFFGVNEHLVGVVQPVAIGPTTEAALLSLGTRPPALAGRPDAAALLACIIELTGR